MEEQTNLQDGREYLQIMLDNQFVCRHKGNIVAPGEIQIKMLLFCNCETVRVTKVN